MRKCTLSSAVARVERQLVRKQQKETQMHILRKEFEQIFEGNLEQNFHSSEKDVYGFQYYMNPNTRLAWKYFVLGSGCINYYKLKGLQDDNLELIARNSMLESKLFDKLNNDLED